MKKRTLLLGLAAALLGALLVYQLPAVNRRLAWRVDAALTYLRGIAAPAKPLPPPMVIVTRLPAFTPVPPTVTSTPPATPLPPTPTATPLPASVSLPAPAYEQQDWNNCGPATLAMALRYYGWQGDQFDISSELKPLREDRNVNVEELDFYVRNRAGWLNIQYRVNGDLALLKQLLAAGLPVMIEEGYTFEETYWPNDDRWAAHYLLVTGYDDATGQFTGQDSFYGPDKVVPYEQLDRQWQAFNRVYILIYPPSQEETVKAILGADWDPAANRQNALETSMAETLADPQDAYAWFNLGTNLSYFERYGEAAQAYDTARSLGLPQRMLRYQFGPFMAYFHSLRTDELMTLTDYALQRTPNSEEAMLWRGWGLYRQGQTSQAIALWREALAARPGYTDALYALEFVGNQ